MTTILRTHQTARDFFDAAFEAIAGFPPLLWQTRLFSMFVDNRVPSGCDIPTGLGKTSVMTIWLLALARQAIAGTVTLPRRLVYVVNRRTVVDQATDEAHTVRDALRRPSVPEMLRDVRDAILPLCIAPDDAASPLAISTLRGELADNREWQADPARPAIVVGTVDMIGSRLLFSGYGAGWKMRAFNAGLIGHDSLIVHDEAHLSPAFGELIRHVAEAQAGAGEPHPTRILELSATQRLRPVEGIFELTDEEMSEPLVQRRVRAPKAIHLHRVDDVTDLPGKLAAAAFAHTDANARVLIYVRTPEQAQKTREILQAELKADGGNQVALLTGTLRGHERDALVRGNHALRHIKAAPARSPLDAPVFLVSTSAGEVGINLDADHLVCDLSTLDSMVQRLGRVNRFGRADEDFTSRVDVFGTPVAGRMRLMPGSASMEKDADDADDVTPYDAALAATRDALGRLPRRYDGAADGSPASLREIMDAQTIQATFAPAPRVVPCTDMLLDAWALTSVREMPGRPPVDRWLHGVEAERPETILVWRAEAVELATRIQRGSEGASDVEAWLDTHRIESRERLREPCHRVATQLDQMAERLAKDDRSLTAVLWPAQGKPFARKIGDLPRDDLAGTTVILPIEAGGLALGMLDGGAGAVAEDVADASGEHAPTRLRVLFGKADAADQWRLDVLGTQAIEVLCAVSSDEPLDAAIEQLLQQLNQGVARGDRLVERGRVIVERNDVGPTRALVSLGRARSAETAFDASAAAQKAQTLEDHLGWAGDAAARLARRLVLPAEVASAIEIAARWHDRGKDRRTWQRAIFHPPPRDPRARAAWEPWAKTAHGRFNYDACRGYRHEFGSLIQAIREPAVAAHPECALILHLIASHHGRARPHFEDNAWDPDASDLENTVAARETMRRYGRLQQRFGRWGLAWLEAILKAADVIATSRGERLQELPT